MVRRSTWSSAVSCALLAALVLAGCERGPEPIRIKFSRTVEIASVRPDQDTPPRRVQAPLRVGVAALLSPTRTLDAYHDLLTYMGQRLGRGVQLFQRGTYAELNDLLKHREIDLAFVCGGALVVAEREFGMQVLVAPQMRGTTHYYSYLIVNRRGAADRLEDLRGMSFAFSDPLSNSGRLALVYQLSLMGETPETFFGRTVFTYSHDNSILAVADGLVDGAVVDSLVYDYLRARDRQAVSETRLIGRWGPYGVPPVVVHPELERSLRSRLKDVLLQVHADPEGQRILHRLQIDRFVEVSPALYDSIRQMEARVRRR